MDQDLRMPTKWLIMLADKIKSDQNFSEMKFISEGGNIIYARRTIATRPKNDPQGGQIDVWDFYVNPGD